MYKRIIALVLVLLLAVPAVSVSAAQSDPTFLVDTVKAEAGQRVDVAIRVENNPGIASIKLKVDYDPALTLNRVSYNSAIGGMSMQPQYLSSPVTVNWFNGVANTTGDWIFVTLSFTVPENAEPGKYPVAISYRIDDVYNIAETNVGFDIVNGGVMVEEPASYLRGDVDENGLVNILDVMAVVNIITGQFQPTVAQSKAADMTEDGTINIFDAMALIGYITGNG